MKIAVIGSGLWGAASARHLAKAGCDVTLIGPDEPANKATHRGVFASHYDEGRITRKNALDPYWCAISIASIDRYAEIEAESGISFYTEAGALMAGRDPWIEQARVGKDKFAIECQVMHAEALVRAFPFFTFPDGFHGLYEPTRAGHVSPRRLVAAQRKAAMAHGAKLRRDVVTGIEDSDQVAVQTPDGPLLFDHVLIAAGYNSDNILGREKHLDVYARTVAFFEVDDAQAARLQNMPSLVWETPDHPYLLPPIRYPDGRIYVKLGGDPEDVALTSERDIEAWFQSDGDADVRDHLHSEILKLMPSLDVKSVSMASCVTSWTKDRLPEIRHLSDRISVATGGNGAGAKCSDEIGRLGAQLVLDRIGEQR